MIYLDYSREAGEWQPNVHGGRENLEAVQFLQEMNATVYKRVPGAITIAEESTSWDGVTRPTGSGGLGFGFKWNMGWMHDTLGYFQRQPVHRSWHHNELTFALVYAWAENFVLPISHDEVVHGKGSLLRKMPGDRWQQLANVRAFLAYMWAHPGKQLIFMGIELGQESEWAEARELDWWLLEHSEHRGVHDLMRDLNRAYVDSPAIWSRDDEAASFGWINANDAGRNVFSFVRHGTEDSADLVCVANFAATPHGDYRLGLPSAGRSTRRRARWVRRLGSIDVEAAGRHPPTPPWSCRRSRPCGSASEPLVDEPLAPEARRVDRPPVRPPGSYEARPPQPAVVRVSDVADVPSSRP